MKPATRVALLIARGPNVFTEFTGLSIKHNAINLGQGFPDFAAPEELLDATREALTLPHNQQYSRSQGYPLLVDSLAEYYRGKLGRPSLDPMSNVVTTVGATEALFTIAQTFLGRGDTAVLFEPFYDSYPADVLLASGAAPQHFITLVPDQQEASGWQLPADFGADIPPNAKLLYLTNPTAIPGKVWTGEELQRIADVAIEHNLIVVSDEVYHELIYDGAEHTSISSLPGMFERTLTVGSVGKSLSATGYKVGYVMGPEHLIQPVASVHEHVPFCVSTPLQAGCATVYQRFNADAAFHQQYFDTLRGGFMRNRDQLVGSLQSIGLKCIQPNSGYFVLADISHLGVDDYTFSRWLTESAGVTSIPCSPFFETEKGKQWSSGHVRFAFCKSNDIIDEACRRLETRIALK